jgi:hypothetical protein
LGDFIIMSQYIKLIGLALMAVSSVSANTQITTEKRLAYSKSLGVEVVADSENWCQPTSNIKIRADEAEFFKKDDFQTFVVKVGKAVIAKECPSANQMQISGSVKESDSTIYKANAFKDKNWQLVIEPLTPISVQVAEDKHTSAADKLNEIAEPSTSPVTTKLHVNTDVGHDNHIAQVKSLTEPEQTELSEPKQVKQQPIVKSTVSISGYTPDTNSRTFANGKEHLQTIPTIDGCNVSATNRQFSKDWVAFPGTGFSCEKGNLVGKGRVLIKDVNARTIADYKNVSAIDGVLFLDIPEHWKPQRLVTNGHETLGIFYDSQDSELNILFIGVAPVLKGYYRRDISALAEDKGLLDEKYAQQVIESLGAVREKAGYKSWHTIFVYNDVDLIPERKYSLKADKPNVRGAKFRIENQAIKREQARIAEQKRLEEAEKLKQLLLARTMQADYEQLMAKTPQELKRLAFNDYIDTFDNESYRLATSGALQLTKSTTRLLIHVDEVDDDVVEIDEPVNMKGYQSGISEAGWYMVDALISGELGQVNATGFIQPKLENIQLVSQCQQAKCDEFGDAATVIRNKYQQPAWNPQSQQGSK